jgi:uncharacterized membrane-anchored protein
MNIRFGLFLAVAAAQLFAPLSQIWRYENVLATGKVYKFQTAPVDPYDAFRGRYVALRFNETSAPIHAGDDLKRGQQAYALLQTGSDGFAKFTEVSATAPKQGDYLKVVCTYQGGNSSMNFSLPFDRFYMEESSAPKAETAYWKYANRRGESGGESFATVRVKNGRGAIEDVFIKNKPIREFIKEQKPD